MHHAATIIVLGTRFMIQSMTGFARRFTMSEWGGVYWEIRSVNQRHLEPHFRLPEALRHIEPALRSQLKKKFSRGKIDCSLQLRTEEAPAESCW